MFKLKNQQWNKILINLHFSRGRAGYVILELFLKAAIVQIKRLNYNDYYSIN